MKEIITKDNSVTFHNEEFDETYHTISGAKEEAMKKHAIPCIDNIRVGKTVRILDVCFGLGYNSAAAIDLLKEKYPTTEIEIIGLEQDETILKRILEIDAEFSSYEIIKKAVQNYNTDNLSIILGDGVKTIENLKGSFDIIFHDPFSTKKMPEFWTEDFFRKEYDLLKKGGVLSTYSCARLVRENLKKVGFSIKDVAPVGRRAPSTIGKKLK